MRRAAFTLIEIIAVVAVIGLLAGATALSLGDSAGRARRADAVSTIAHADRMARLAGERLGRPCVLHYDLDDQRIVRELPGAGVMAASHPIALGRDVWIDRLVTAGSVNRPPRTHESGDVAVAVSTAGRSETYAVRLAFDDGQTWLVFAGLTGQMTVIEHDEQVDNLVRLLATGRSDAD